MTVTSLSSVSTKEKGSAFWSYLSLAVVLVAAALFFSYNMFGFPLYVGDEGIYMAGAYAVLNKGWLTPYTYWYDHAPAGWLLIAAWGAVTGGLDTFGAAVNSGRVLMLFLHLITVTLMFFIVVRHTGNRLAAVASGLLYALSPLVLIHMRTVRLDTIMVFWLLIAAAVLLNYKGKLWPIVFSGLWFGIAVLSKESALLLVPAFIYGVWVIVDKSHWRFARAGWLFAAVSLISLYPLYAALRGELINWDLSSPLDGSGASVSLVGSALWQLSRSGGYPWDPTSDFYHFLTTDWLINDPWILGLGLLATGWNFFRGGHRHRLVALLSLLALISIAHGNQVYEFYIIPLLPLLALNFGLALANIATMSGLQGVPAMAAVGVVALGWINLSQQPNLFYLDINKIQRQAVTWIEEHVPSDAQIVVDDELWVDLRNGTEDHAGFPGTHSHWKVANDPAVHHDLFHDDWRSIDYLVMSPGLEKIYAQYPDKLPNQAYQRSTPVASFNYGDAVVEIRKVNNAGLAVDEMLNYSYKGFKNRYIRNGQVRPENGYTDARDQAAALLMAVWTDDRQTFDELWGWTLIHLQRITGLHYDTNEPGVSPRSTTEADTDIALALLLAERRWNDASYGRHASRIIDAIWQYEVVTIDGKPYLAAGDWAVRKDKIIVSPATFAPYAYHLFAEADPQHDWWYLLDTNYQLLTEVTTDPLGEEQSAGLPPAYVGIDRKTGALEPNPTDVSMLGNTFNEYAAQIYWRVALDAQWHDDERADDYLLTSDFLNDEWENRGEFAQAYTHAGKPLASEAGMIFNSNILSKFLTEDPDIAHEIFATKLAATYVQQDDEGQWGKKPTIAEERWAWLSTGLYYKALPYQWHFETESKPTSSKHLPQGF